MDTTSESNSVKSAVTPTSLKTSNSAVSSDSKKQVGFSKIKPRLIIPSSTGPTPSQEYFRKQFAFNFDYPLHEIKGFTKTGLGAGEKCAYYLFNQVKKWSRKWFTHMFLSIVLVLYTVGGGFLFEHIEGKKHDINPPEDVESSRINLIWHIQNMTGTFSSEGFFELKKRIEDHENIVQYWQSTHHKWTFWNAIVFCGTIYTSIGYGHIYPKTMMGKALTIVYAIIGIPLFLLALTDFGKLFTRSIKFLWSFVRRLYRTGSCRTVRKTAHVDDIFKGAQKMYEIATFTRPSTETDPENPAPGDETPATPAISVYEIDDQFNLPISVAIIILIVYMFLGALIYCFWENWNFFDSFYFVFISMSTVGFGDMVPDDPACMIVSIVYLVFGLALMSMCINVVQVKLSDTFKQASTKIGATIGLTVAEDDGSITTVPPENIEMPKVHEPKSIANGTPLSETSEKLEDRL